MEIVIVLLLTAAWLTGLLSLPFLLKRTHRSPYLGLVSRDDVVLGSTTRLISIPLTQVRLTRHEQKYHAAIFGRSGSGKSKLLQSVFLQQLKQGKGVGLLEPHHDLSFDCLTSLVGQGFFRDPSSFEKLVYLDWGNGDYVPFNVLAGRGDPHTIALNALDAMLRVWPELQEAPMFQTLFLSATMTLVANGLPLTFLYQLLTEKPFRDECLTRVKDPLVHQCFDNYDKLGRDQPQAAGSTLRRSYLLSFSPLARYTLGQPENVLDFRKLMDEGRAFIINLGNIQDAETRKLLGAMLMVQIEQAALSRSDLLPSQRTPCTLLVDEWPSFAAQERTISHILSQTRKFNLRLYLAAQSLAQVDSSRLVGAMENCRLKVAFGVGRDSAETQARHIGDVDPMLVKESQMTETQHNTFMAVTEQFESWTSELQNLKARQAYVKLEGRPAIKMRTSRIGEPRVSQSELAQVLTTYRRRYQRTQEEAEQAIASLSLPLPSATNSSSAPAYTRVYQSKPFETSQAD
jgi:hypothetical protein